MSTYIIHQIKCMLLIGVYDWVSESVPVCACLRMHVCILPRESNNDYIAMPSAQLLTDFTECEQMNDSNATD